jgi:hypothetical protein
MKKIRIIILTFLMLITISACGTLREGFSSQKKKSTDEFFVEKKAPLVMPPNYNELPTPKNNNSLDESDENSVKELIINSENNTVKKTNTSKSNISVENSILDKIKE